MVTIDGVLTGVSVAHQHASVDIIAAATPEDPSATLDALLDEPRVDEAFVLTTCNRVEYYVVTSSPQVGHDLLETWVETVPQTATLFLSHDEAIEHLVRVTAGLESQVLGEHEIIGQVRDAFHQATHRGAIGSILEPVLLKALHIGERARTETSINEGVVSLASAAALCANERVDLPTATVLVVGAGEMGRRVAEALAEYGVGELLIANRSTASAEAIAEAIGGDVVDLDRIPEVLERTAVCIAATGSSAPVLTPASVPPRTSLVLVDLGQPPDVAPSIRERAAIAYYDLDRLRVITDRTHERRAESAVQVERIIESELGELHRRFKRNQAESVIAAMRGGADAIKAREVERAQRRLAHGETTPEAVIDDLANALVNHLMAAPTDALRDAAEDEDWSTIYAAIQIFDPEIETEDLPAQLTDRREVATDD